MSLGIKALGLVPKNTVSRLAGHFSRSKVSRAVIPWFVKKYAFWGGMCVGREAGVLCN